MRSRGASRRLRLAAALLVGVPLGAPILSARPQEPAGPATTIPPAASPSRAIDSPIPGPAEGEAVPAQAAYHRGLELLAAGTPREAVDSFRTALAEGYRPPADAYYGLGLAYKQVPLRRLHAIRAFRDAVRRDPEALEPLYELADTYLALDGWDAQREARRALVTIIARDPLYRDAVSRWASLYPDRKEQRRLAETLRRRLQAAFDEREAEILASVYVQIPDEDGLVDLLNHWKDAGDSSVTALHYWEARLSFLRGDAARATREWEAGLDAVRTARDLEPYWADLDPLLGPEDRELAETRSLGGKVAFIRGFWIGRDPLPFTGANERLAEHYRRIDQVRRRYLWKKPLAKEKVIGHYVDDLGRPSFDTRMEGRSVDDRGTIYLRHGEPETRFVQVGGGEYWRYDRPGFPGERLQFHFKLMDGPMGRGNDTVYSILPTTDVGAANVRAGHAGSEGVENTLLGTGTDTYAFEVGEKVLPVAVAAAAFRSRESPARTDLLMAVGTPLASLRKLEGKGPIVLLQQLKLYDVDYREELVLSDTLRLDAVGGEGRALVGAFQISAYPGTRRYALQVQGRASGAIGLARGDLTLPSYAERKLQLSEILFASQVAPAAQVAAGLRREGLAIRPLLTRGLARTQPLHLYYEIYDLSAAPDGRARYRLEYRVSAEEAAGPGVLARVFGAGSKGAAADDEGVALAFEKEREGAAERIGETISLDLSQLPPGRYRVTVTVRDLATGALASRVVVLELRPGEDGGEPSVDVTSERVP